MKTFLFILLVLTFGALYYAHQKKLDDVVKAQAVTYTTNLQNEVKKAEDVQKKAVETEENMNKELKKAEEGDEPK